MNSRTAGSWFWAGLIFGPIPTFAFALALGILVFICRLIIYAAIACFIAVVWARTAYIRWRGR